MTEIITNEAGTKRARIEHDGFGYAMKPDGCYFATVYSLDDRGRSAEVLGQDSCVETDLSNELATIWDDTRDMEDVEMILRGTENLCDDCYSVLRPYDDSNGVYTWTSAESEVCPEWEGEESDWHKPRYDFSDNPVVGFAYIERQDSKMVNIVTLADLKHWGFGSVEDYRITAGHDDPSHGNLTEWEAWADDEVYYVALEEKVTEYVRITDLAGNVIREAEDGEAWEEFDSCGGFYGIDAARESANDQLHDSVGN